MVPILIDLCRHTDPFARYDTAFALGELGDERARPALEALLHDHTMPLERQPRIELTTHSIATQARQALEKLRTR